MLRRPLGGAGGADGAAPRTASRGRRRGRTALPAVRPHAGGTGSARGRARVPYSARAGPAPGVPARTAGAGGLRAPARAHAKERGVGTVTDSALSLSRRDATRGMSAPRAAGGNRPTVRGWRDRTFAPPDGAGGREVPGDRGGGRGTSVRLPSGREGVPGFLHHRTGAHTAAVLTVRTRGHPSSGPRSGPRTATDLPSAAARSFIAPLSPRAGRGPLPRRACRSRGRRRGSGRGSSR